MTGCIKPLDRLPLDPEALAQLDESELDSLIIRLDLDSEQQDCAEAAVSLVRAGGYRADPPATVPVFEVGNVRVALDLDAVADLRARAAIEAEKVGIDPRRAAFFFGPREAAR